MTPRTHITWAKFKKLFLFANRTIVLYNSALKFIFWISLFWLCVSILCIIFIHYISIVLLYLASVLQWMILVNATTFIIAHNIILLSIINVYMCTYIYLTCASITCNISIVIIFIYIFVHICLQNDHRICAFPIARLVSLILTITTMTM